MPNWGVRPRLDDEKVSMGGVVETLPGRSERGTRRGRRNKGIWNAQKEVSRNKVDLVSEKSWDPLNQSSEDKSAPPLVGDPRVKKAQASMRREGLQGGSLSRGIGTEIHKAPLPLSAHALLSKITDCLHARTAFFIVLGLFTLHLSSMCLFFLFKCSSVWVGVSFLY